MAQISPVYVNNAFNCDVVNHSINHLAEQINTTSLQLNAILFQFRVMDRDIKTCSTVQNIANQYIETLNQTIQYVQNNVLNSTNNSLQKPQTHPAKITIDYNNYNYINTNNSINWKVVSRLTNTIQKYETDNNISSIIPHITNILNDYHHIIQNHHYDYHQIYHFISKQNICNPSTCSILKKHSSKQIIVDHNYSKNVAKALMDSIHIYLYHCYDLGFRLNPLNVSVNKTNVIEEQKGELDPGDLDGIDPINTCIKQDNRQTQYDIIDNINISTLNATHNLLKTIRGNVNNNFLHNRFNTSNRNAVFEENRVNYSFGERYDYFDKKSSMYVKQKYKCFKAEILSHIGIDNYKNLDLNARQLLKTDASKQIKLKYTKYGLKKNGIFSLQNVQSVYLYCSYDKLCYKFSQSFRRIKKDETLKAMKIRNSKYWWLSKLLRETVECYGTTMKDTAIKKYYHGTSFLAFDLFMVKLKAPISTSTSIEVAYNFSGSDGIVVEFGTYSQDLTYFNCSWISPFAGEDERLFIGGNGYVQIISIRLVKTKENYYWFIQSFRHFHCLLRGSQHINENDDQKTEFNDFISHSPRFCGVKNGEKVTKGDAKIINELINNKKNKFPIYINKIFKLFTTNRKEITINIHDLYTYYRPFITIFNFKSSIFCSDNLLEFNKIITIFPHCIRIKIECKNDIQNKYEKFTKDMLLKMLSIIKKINLINTKLKLSLKVIQLSKIDASTVSPSKIFKENGWEVKTYHNAIKFHRKSSFYGKSLSNSLLNPSNLSASRSLGLHSNGSPTGSSGDSGSLFKSPTPDTHHTNNHWDPDQPSSRSPSSPYLGSRSPYRSPYSTSNNNNMIGFPDLKLDITLLSVINEEKEKEKEKQKQKQKCSELIKFLNNPNLLKIFNKYIRTKHPRDYKLLDFYIFCKNFRKHALTPKSAKIDIIKNANLIIDKFLKSSSKSYLKKSLKDVTKNEINQKYNKISKQNNYLSNHHNNKQNNNLNTLFDKAQNEIFYELQNKLFLKKFIKSKTYKDLIDKGLVK